MYTENRNKFKKQQCIPISIYSNVIVKLYSLDKQILAGKRPSEKLKNYISSIQSLMSSVAVFFQSHNIILLDILHAWYNRSSLKIIKFQNPLLAFKIVFTYLI